MANRGIDERNTKRLRLRRPMAADLHFITTLFAQPAVTAHRPDPTPDTAEISAAPLRRDIQHWRDRGFGRWAVEASGQLIGFGGVTVAKDGALNLSYHLDPENWGKGFASELVAEIISVAFGRLNAVRVIGLARPANPASCRVLEKARATFEGEVDLHGAPTRLYSFTRTSVPVLTRT